jgi:hypothetical protein
VLKLRKRFNYLIRVKGLSQKFRTARTHGTDDLIWPRITRRGEESDGVIAALAQLSRDQSAIFALIKVNHTDALLELIQHSLNFPGADMSIDIVNNVSARRLCHQILKLIS